MLTQENEGSKLIDQIKIKLFSVFKKSNSKSKQTPLTQYIC